MRIDPVKDAIDEVRRESKPGDKLNYKLREGFKRTSPASRTHSLVKTVESNQIPFVDAVQIEGGAGHGG